MSDYSKQYLVNPTLKNAISFVRNTRLSGNNDTLVSGSVFKMYSHSPEFLREAALTCLVTDKVEFALKLAHKASVMEPEVTHVLDEVAEYVRSAYVDATFPCKSKNDKIISHASKARPRVVGISLECKCKCKSKTCVTAAMCSIIENCVDVDKVCRFTCTRPLSIDEAAMFPYINSPTTEKDPLYTLTVTCDQRMIMPLKYIEIGMDVMSDSNASHVYLGTSENANDFLFTPAGTPYSVAEGTGPVMKKTANRRTVSQRSVDTTTPATSQKLLAAYHGGDKAAARSIYFRMEKPAESDTETYLKCTETLPGARRVCADIIPITDPLPGYEGRKYNTFNPSMYQDGNVTWCNVRNGAFDRHGAHFRPVRTNMGVDTRNITGILTDDLEFKMVAEIVDRSDLHKYSQRVAGFEDAKIFMHEGVWKFVATSYESSPMSTDVIMGILEAEPGNTEWSATHVVPLNGDMTCPERPEKNWMPLLSGDSDNVERLRLVYSLIPLHIVNVDYDGTVTTDVKREWVKEAGSDPLGEFRGSSCMVPWDDGWLCVSHEVVFLHGCRNYLHRFVWLSDDMTELMYSPHFTMGCGTRIEYVNGMVIKKDNIVLSFGMDDRAAMAVKVSIERVKSLLTNRAYSTSPASVVGAIFKQA